jgi:hypothetical protein
MKMDTCIFKLQFPSWVIKVRIILSFAKLSIQIAGKINEGCLLFQKIKQVKNNISLFIVPMHRYN